MRAALPLIAVLFATCAAADGPRDAKPAADGQPARLVPASPAIKAVPALDSPPGISVPGRQLAPDSQRLCRDRIEQVRAASGLPKLDRDDPTDDKPLLIAAVDKRIGACSYMVMRDNLSDIRPLPEPKGPARVRKIQ